MFKGYCVLKVTLPQRLVCTPLTSFYMNVNTGEHNTITWCFVFGYIEVCWQENIIRMVKKMLCFIILYPSFSNSFAKVWLYYVSMFKIPRLQQCECAHKRGLFGPLALLQLKYKTWKPKKIAGLHHSMNAFCRLMFNYYFTAVWLLVAIFILLLCFYFHIPLLVWV